MPAQAQVQVQHNATGELVSLLLLLLLLPLLLLLLLPTQRLKTSATTLAAVDFVQQVSALGGSRAAHSPVQLVAASVVVWYCASSLDLNSLAANVFVALRGTTTATIVHSQPVS